MSSVLITGATRGLGLATAHAAAAAGAHVLVAGRSPEATRAAAAAVGGEPVVLDLERLADVARVAGELPPVDAVVANAGLQVVDGIRRTPDGFETTFQVNHLAHLVLVDRLLERAAPPRRVVLVGSGTHDPARRSGMPAPFPVDDLAAVARGEQGGATPVDGRRRYTTSKLLNAASAAALARERPDVHVACFDPGLMPGTGLARDYRPPQRALWSLVLPVLRVLPFASTPQASGRALARLAAGEAVVPSGAYVDHRLRVVDASAQARDEAFQDRVLRGSRALADAAQPSWSSTAPTTVSASTPW